MRSRCDHGLLSLVPDHSVLPPPVQPIEKKTPMKFFRMHEPRNSSDYQHTWINGAAEPTCGLPGVECSVCGRTGGLGGGLVPYRLPDELERELSALDYFPIPEADHGALRARIEEALRKSHPDMGPLPGGALFSPVTWKVPSRPDGDIFWADLDFPIVSGRVAAALRSLGAAGFDLIPIDEVRCGKRSAAKKAPIPASGEPEDLEKRATGALKDGQQFFALAVQAEGRLSSKMRERPACPGCGDMEVDRKKGWEAWKDAMWAGDDIFHFPTTLWIIVTERVADLFAHLGVGNVEFTPPITGKPVPENS